MSMEEIVSIDLTAEEKRVAERYAAAKGMTLEQAFKAALFEKVESGELAEVEDLTFKSSLTMEQIEQNFANVSVFEEIKQALNEALEYEKGNLDLKVNTRTLSIDDEENDLIDPSTGTKLTPSPGGKECLGNGSWVGYECCCDECDHYLECFPEAKMSD